MARKTGKTAWIVRTRSADPSYEESMGSAVYKNEEDLKREAGRKIADFVKRDMEDFELSDADEEQIQEILDTLKAGKFWDAYKMYEDYVSDIGTQDYVEIEETFIR